MLNGSDVVQPPQDHVVPETRGGFSALESLINAVFLYTMQQLHIHILYIHLFDLGIQTISS